MAIQIEEKKELVPDLEFSGNKYKDVVLFRVFKTKSEIRIITLNKTSKFQHLLVLTHDTVTKNKLKSSNTEEVFNLLKNGVQSYDPNISTHCFYDNSKDKDSKNGNVINVNNYKISLTSNLSPTKGNSMYIHCIFHNAEYDDLLEYLFEFAPIKEEDEKRLLRITNDRKREVKDIKKSLKDFEKGINKYTSEMHYLEQQIETIKMYIQREGVSKGDSKYKKVVGRIEDLKFQASFFPQGEQVKKILAKIGELNKDLVQHKTSALSFIDTEILSEEERLQLLEWCGGENKQWDFKLLYSGERDGFTQENFHSKCDDKDRVVVVIHANGCVFGGFNPGSFKSKKGSEFQKESFVFSLRNSSGKDPVKMLPTGNFNEKKIYGPYSNPNHGPIFGFGHDLFIHGNMKSKNSYANLGHTYKSPYFDFGTDEAKSFLGGSKYFSVDAIEVFKWSDKEFADDE